MTTTEVARVASPTDVRDRLATDGGFTFDPHTASLVFIGDRDGWAIARAGSERIIGPTLDDSAEFLGAFLGAWDEAATTGGLVGGWYSTDRGVYMCEVTDVHQCDRATALVLGMRADQETVMNLRTGETAAVPQYDEDEAYA
jgi:hypothetical protein